MADIDYGQAIRNATQASEDMPNQMVGQGHFRDTGRQSSGIGESLDSVIGAPARVAVEEAQKGNLSWNAVARIFRQIGADPRTAPTGYDLASKVTDDPKLGTFLATAIDFGAQFPGMAHITPGVVGEVRGVKSMGNVADALEAFAERGKAAPSLDTKIAQLHGQAGQTLNAMPQLIENAKTEMLSNSKPGYQRNKINLDQEARAANAAEPGRFWHDENDHSFTDDAKQSLDSLANRFGDDPKAEKILDAIREAHQGPDNMPYMVDPTNTLTGIPNFSAKPTGQIGTPGISGHRTSPDPFAWVDSKWGAGKQLLDRHNSIGMPADIHTSSDLIGRDDYVKSIPDGSNVNLYFGPNDPEIHRQQNPINPSNLRLENAAKRLEGAGINVNRVYPEGDNVMPIGRKPDSLSGTTMLDPGAAAGAAGIQPARTREEKIAFLQAQQGAQPATTREQKIAFLQAKANQPPEQQGMAQTALEGFGNGASLGHLPQLQAAAAKPIYAGLNAVTGQDIQPDSYVQERDANIARQAQQAKDNPYTSFASKAGGIVAGGIASSPMLPARAAGILGRIRQAGQIGSAYGALANPGDTQGQVDMSGQIPQRLDNAAKSGAASALTAGILEVPGIAKNALNSSQKFLADRVGRNAEYTPAENAAQVQGAAKTLGINSVPKAVLTSNPTYQKLESGLSQSGSLPAKSIRDQYSNFFKSLEDASKKISDLKSNDSDFSLGKQIQGSMARQVEDAKAPVSEMYNELTPHLRKIEVNEDVVNKAFGALKRNPLFQNQQGQAVLNEYKAATLQQPELASLKEFRSTLRDSVSKTSAPIDQKRMDAIASAVTSIRDNSINALKEHMPEHMHPEVDNLIGDISLADAAHKANLNDLNSVKSLVGNKPVNSQAAFLDKLSNLKESELADRASNLDVSTLRNLQTKYPPVFDKAKTAIVNDMIKSSTSPVNGFNDTAFLKKYDGLDKEMKDLVFDPKMQSHIEAVKTLKQAIPDKLGPSGTPEGKMMMDMFNPKRNALDYGVKKTLEAASSPRVQAPAVVGKEPTPQTALQLILSRPTPIAGSPLSVLPKAADAKPKGEDKWANDGAQKLIDHAPDDKATIERARGAMSDPKVKSLLIQASDLKVGSPAMEKTMTKLKSKLASGDE